MCNADVQDAILKNENIVKNTSEWVKCFVVELNICPFAKQALLRNRIRFSVSTATSNENLLRDLKTEIELLDVNTEIETTLLIHAEVLQNFYNYNEFLSVADNLLVQMQLVGTYQIASFHPDYQFDGTKADDVENYTNRSPYPMLHILREDSVSTAVAKHPDADLIPKRNIEMMKQMGTLELDKMLHKCLTTKT